MENMLEKLKKVNLKYVHLVVIIIGSIFISLSIFHTNIWFDESYSIAIAKHSFIDIWQISGNDVHPAFYYFCLHILNLIFGDNIIIYRIFSTLTIIILSILGYTHIKKDFGEKTGILFSFLVLFLPVSAQYASEIRMYSLGMLLSTIMAIYAYRIYKGKINKVTYIIFGISSLLVSYTHYYGLILAGIINLILFIYLCKNSKEKNNDLIKFLVVAFFQIILYIPWLLYFIKQLSGVSSGFWITLSFPETLYEILTMQYKGNLSMFPIILSTIFYSYIVYLVAKTKKEERKPATWCFTIYISIILIVLFISLCMQSVILLYRYLLIITGLLIFALAFFMAKDTKVKRIISICSIILIVSITSNVLAIKENYNHNNKECINYIKEEIQQGDIIIYSNVISGAVITTELLSTSNISYFYDKYSWNVDEAYKAFAPYMQIKDTLEEILDNYKGRIWIVENGNTNELQNEIEEKYNIEKIKDKQFNIPYKNNSYTIELIIK